MDTQAGLIQVEDDFFEASGRRLIDDTPGINGQYALAIPEIVENILQLATGTKELPGLYCRRWLRGCALVNRVWANEALRLLWSSDPYVTMYSSGRPPNDTRERSGCLTRLLSLPQDRRQYYASNVRTIRDWASTDGTLEALENVEFLSLRSMEILISNGTGRVPELNAPNVRKLELCCVSNKAHEHDFVDDDAFWEQVERSYPNLVEISFNLCDGWQCNQLSRRFAECSHMLKFPHLQHLELDSHSPSQASICDLRILHDAAFHPSLKNLEIPRRLPYNDYTNPPLLDILDPAPNTPQPFAHLTNLLLNHIPLTVFNALAQNLTSLIGVEISGLILDADRIVPPRNPMLERLDIGFCSCYNRVSDFSRPPLVTTDWLMDVAHSKPCLKHLEINSKQRTARWIDFEDLRDEMFGEFVSLLPQLEIFFMDRETLDGEVRRTLTPKMKESIGKKLVNARYILIGDNSKDAWVSKAEQLHPAFWRYVRDANSRNQLLD